MITNPTQNDMFQEQVDAVVIAVNTVGVAGAGQAKQAKMLDNGWYQKYNEACRAGKVRVGQEPFAYDRGEGASPRYFIAVPTKEHFSNNSTPEIITAGAQELRKWLDNPLKSIYDRNTPVTMPRVEALAINSVALPAMGAGLGKLDWSVSEPIIRAALDGCATNVVLYQPREIVREPRTDAEYTALFEKQSEQPPLPPVGKWHQNWFSNMVAMEQPLVEDGIAYRTVEAYYQASKVPRLEDKKRLADMPPHQSKRQVRSMQQDPAWDLDKGMAAMRKALEHKFAPGTNALGQLLETGTDEIVEWNNWSDRTWGKSLEDGTGRNLLGRMLMEIRRDARLREQQVLNDLGETPAAARDREALEGANDTFVNNGAHIVCLQLTEPEPNEDIIRHMANGGRTSDLPAHMQNYGELQPDSISVDTVARHRAYLEQNPGMARYFRYSEPYATEQEAEAAMERDDALGTDDLMARYMNEDQLLAKYGIDFGAVQTRGTQIDDPLAGFETPQPQQEQAQAQPQGTVTANGIWPAPFTAHATWIGSRRTPPNAQDFLRESGAIAEAAGLKGFSGGAVGADQAAISGYKDPAHVEVYLPALTLQEGVNRQTGRSYTRVVDNEPRNPGEVVINSGVYFEYANRLVDRIHPAPHNLGVVARELMRRNNFELLGPHLDKMPLFVGEWAPPKGNHQVDGGTNYVHTLTREMGGALFNLHPKAGDYYHFLEARKAIQNRDMDTLSRILDQQRERHAVQDIGLTNNTTLKARQAVTYALANLAGEMTFEQAKERLLDTMDLESYQVRDRKLKNAEAALEGNSDARAFTLLDSRVVEEVTNRLELQNPERAKKISAAQLDYEHERVKRDLYGSNATPLLREINTPEEQVQVEWAFASLAERLIEGPALSQSLGSAILSAVNGRGVLNLKQEHVHGKLVIEPDNSLTVLGQNGLKFAPDVTLAQAEYLREQNGKDVALVRDSQNIGQVLPMSRAQYNAFIAEHDGADLGNAVSERVAAEKARHAERNALHRLEPYQHAFGQIALNGDTVVVKANGLQYETQETLTEAPYLKNFIGQTGVVSGFLTSSRDPKPAVVFAPMTREEYAQIKDLPAEQIADKTLSHASELAGDWMEGQHEQYAQDQFEREMTTPPIGSKENPIVLDVVNMEHLPNGVHEDLFYCGRTTKVAEELGVPHLLGLSNPYRTEKAGGTMNAGEAAAAFDKWFKAEFEKRNPDVINDFKKFLSHAVKNGRAEAGCHDHPGACHCDTLVREGAKVLRGMGKEVITPGLNYKQIQQYEKNVESALAARENGPLNLAAKERLLGYGYSAADLAEIHTPWETMKGQVIAADEKDFKVEVGNGKWRSVSQEHFEQPFQVGDLAHLNNEGGRPVEVDPRARTRGAELTLRP